MKLHLVRHPITEIAPGICYGASDVPVATGVAMAIARGLASSLPRNVPVITSPLSRCDDLARAVSALLEAPSVTRDERLREMHFGDWEMRHWDDIGWKGVDAWVSDMVNYRPGGGESVLDVARRVQAFERDIARRAEPELIVVCHAGTIRLLRAGQQGLSLQETALLAAGKAHETGYGTVTVVQW
jgi:alpha-ribazole phosphatase